MKHLLLAAASAVLWAQAPPRYLQGNIKMSRCRFYNPGNRDVPEERFA